ncbi:MAG: HNH endonuclease family protein [Thermoplasmata archaeon]
MPEPEGYTSPTDPTLTFLDAVETVDLRVYKTRGTNPRKEMALLAQEAGSLTPREISDRLRDFTIGFMDDPKFASSLRGPVYKENEGLRRILLEWEEFNRDKSKDPGLSLDNWVSSRATRSGLSVKDFQGFRADEPTVDHILAETPTFKGRGFVDEQQFLERMHHLGNLTLVEKSINSAAQNKAPEQKASESKLYSASAYSSTRRLGALIHQRSTAGKLFDAEALEERTELLANFVAVRWHIWT